MLKKTISATENDQERQSAQVKTDINKELHPPNMMSHTGLSLKHDYLAKKNKIPTALLQTLRNTQKSLRESIGESEEIQIKKSRIGSIIKSKLKKSLPTCEICENEIKEQSKMWITECEHKFNFCESCLHHYVIYQVQKFEQVRCPHEDCNNLLITSSNLFKNLPLEIQNKYKKISQFYKTSNDPTLKLCPSENCEGVIRIIEGFPAVCDQCKVQYCPKCFLKMHEGQCDQHEIDFFQNNLHFRQCKKCKFVIEKNQGCNHMTCRCGNQFCYVCGAAWAHEHICGELIDPNNPAAGYVMPEAEACCDCGCLEECCGPAIACIIKAPLKLFLLLLSLLMVLFIFIFRDLIALIGILLLTLVAGLFGFSFEFLCDQDCPLALVLAIFFPVCMVVGLVTAFSQIFCDIVPQMWAELCILYMDLFESIMAI